MIDTIRKVPEWMIKAQTKLKRAEGYNDLFVFLCLPNPRKSPVIKQLKLNKTRKFIEEAIMNTLAFGVQPITGIISRNSEFSEMAFTLSCDWRRASNLILKKMKAEFVKGELNAHQSMEIMERYNVFKNIIAGKNWSKTPTMMGVLNQRYVLNYPYMSLTNVMLFDEYEFWDSLEKIDEDDIKIINGIIKKHTLTSGLDSDDPSKKIKWDMIRQGAVINYEVPERWKRIKKHEEDLVRIMSVGL